MRKILLFATLFLMLSSLHSQDEEARLSPQEIDKYKEECRQMVSYLEGTLNFLGDSTSTVQEKEIVINNSYDKIFRDSEVQVEDDLDEARETPVKQKRTGLSERCGFFLQKCAFTFDVSR